MTIPSPGASNRPPRPAPRGLSPVARAGDQRHRRHHPYQPRARRSRARSIASSRSREGTRRSMGPRARRGDGATSTPKRCCRLTGAEAAVVVNNNAAATMIVLAALAAGREVIVRAATGRDRRWLPRARCDGAVGRDAARGGDDEQDPRHRPRRRYHRAHRAHPARPPVKFPHRGLHRTAVAPGSRRPRQKVQHPRRRRSRSGYLLWGQTGDSPGTDRGQSRDRPGSDP